MIFLDLLKENALHRPDMLVIQTPNKSFSYFEFECITNTIANDIFLSFVKPNRNKKKPTIAIQVGNTLHMILLMCGILKAGCDCALIHNEYSQTAISDMLQKADVKICFTDSYKGEGVFVNTREYLSMDSAIVVNRPCLGVEGHIITFTSGSTGVPKKIVFNEHSAMNFINFFVDELHKNNVSSFVLSCSPAFSMGIVNVILCIGYGFKLILSENRDYYKNTFQILHLIDSYECDALMIPTPFFDLLAASPLIMKKIPQSLHLIFTGGQTLRLSDSVVSFLKSKSIALLNNYGTTETLGISNYKVDYDDIAREDGMISVGQAIPNIEIYILNSEDESVFNEVGDIAVRFGFKNNLVKSDNDYYRTGDVGFFDSSNMLYVVGRKDDYCKLRGYRVNLKGIETKILEVRGVTNVVVLLMNNNSGTTQICAAIEAKPQLKDVIKTHLLNALPEYMIPSHIEFVDVIPRTPSGKNDRIKVMRLLENVL